MEPRPPPAGLDEGHRLEDVQRELPEQPAPREATGRPIDRMAHIDARTHQVLVEALSGNTEPIGDIRRQQMAHQGVDEPLEMRRHVRLQHLP